MMRRLGYSEGNILAVQSNLATTYHMLDRPEEANRMLKDVYSGRQKVLGEEHKSTIIAANNYAHSLVRIECFEKAKLLLRKTIPVARRVLGANDNLTLRTRWLYANALYEDPRATLHDLREAVETLESVAPLWERVYGISHPETLRVQGALEDAREGLATRSA